MSNVRLKLIKRKLIFAFFFMLVVCSTLHYWCLQKTMMQDKKQIKLFIVLQFDLQKCMFAKKIDR